jgi:phospholipid/cholesterol/gamma-HCH transport system ATP-binding protein
VREIMHTLPPAAQEAIRDDLEGTGLRLRVDDATAPISTVGATL